MTEKTANIQKIKNTFGGLIYPSDYAMSYGGTRHIASRILSDWDFDSQCMKNERNRTNYCNEKKAGLI